MIKLNAVGDIFFGDYTISLGFGIRSYINKYGFDYVFDNVKMCLKDADIVFGNLETVMSSIGEDVNNIQSIICRGENKFVNVLKNGGFNMMNIANNHILQHGVDPFRDTINVLNINNIDVVGIRGGNCGVCKPLLKYINGKNICFLGYSFVKENYYKREALYGYGNKKDILNDIKNLKNENDYVIVSCHWGIEFIHKPSINIKRIAREMVDSGASLVIGHHPHVPQGIEKYKNSIIFYSLGNFLFDSLWSKYAKESMIASITLHDNIVDYKIVPVYINDGYQVLHMSKNNALKFISYIEKISSEINIDEYDDIEDLHCNYYIEANNALLKNQIKKSLFMLKNIYRLDKRFIKYMLKKI